MVQWAWEFLRRNEQYQKDFNTLSAKQIASKYRIEHPCNPGLPFSYDVEKQLGLETIHKSTIKITHHNEFEYFREWRLMRCDPEHKNPGIDEIRFPERFQTFSDNEIVLKLDLNRPLKFLLEDVTRVVKTAWHVKHWNQMIAMQDDPDDAREVVSPLLDPELPILSKRQLDSIATYKMHFPVYLRILDAKQAGIGDKEIAENLYAGEQGDTKDKVKKNRAKAAEYCQRYSEIAACESNEFNILALMHKLNPETPLDILEKQLLAGEV